MSFTAAQGQFHPAINKHDPRITLVSYNSTIHISNRTIEKLPQVNPSISLSPAILAGRLIYRPHGGHVRGLEQLLKTPLPPLLQGSLYQAISKIHSGPGRDMRIGPAMKKKGGHHLARIQLRPGQGSQEGLVLPAPAQPLGRHEQVIGQPALGKRPLGEYNAQSLGQELLAQGLFHSGPQDQPTGIVTVFVGQDDAQETKILEPLQAYADDRTALHLDDETVGTEETHHEKDIRLRYRGQQDLAAGQAFCDNCLGLALGQQMLQNHVVARLDLQHPTAKGALIEKGKALPVCPKEISIGPNVLLLIGLPGILHGLYDL